jgi:hypothetical protein
VANAVQAHDLARAKQAEAILAKLHGDLADHIAAITFPPSMNNDVGKLTSALKDLATAEVAASKATNFNQYDNATAAADDAASRWTLATDAVERDLGP